MEINGLQLAFIDVPPEYTAEYNRWYDLDHLPEHLAKADVVLGNRYVADRSVQNLPASLSSDTFGGHPPYLTIYWFGGPLDMMSEEARQGWLATDRSIVKQGRYWMKGRTMGGGKFRLGAAVARPGVLVSDRAIPYLSHRGVIVAYGKAPSAERRAEAIDWWTGTHLVDLFTVPGIIAAVRGDPVDEAEDHVLHVLVCDEEPAEVMSRIADLLHYAGGIGRWPPHGNAYEPEEFLPYNRIVPLEHNFDFAN